jgi:thiol-disulfide isomerase/thioredoxin
VTWLKKELGLNGHGMALLLVFGSTSCPICKQVMKAAEKLSNMWKESAQIAVLIEGGDAKESKPVGADSSFIRIHTSNIYRQQLNIPMVPFAFVVDDKQLVLGKGVVNEVSHMEGLLSLISEKDSRA